MPSVFEYIENDNWGLQGPVEAGYNGDADEALTNKLYDLGGPQLLSSAKNGDFEILRAGRSGHDGATNSYAIARGATTISPSTTTNATRPRDGLRYNNRGSAVGDGLADYSFNPADDNCSCIMCGLPLIGTKKNAGHIVAVKTAFMCLNFDENLVYNIQPIHHVCNTKESGLSKPTKSGANAGEALNLGEIRNRVGDRGIFPGPPEKSTSPRVPAVVCIKAFNEILRKLNVADFTSQDYITRLSYNNAMDKGGIPEGVIQINSDGWLGIIQQTHMAEEIINMLQLRIRNINETFANDKEARAIAVRDTKNAEMRMIRQRNEAMSLTRRMLTSGMNISKYAKGIYDSLLAKLRYQTRRADIAETRLIQSNQTIRELRAQLTQRNPFRRGGAGRAIRSAPNMMRRFNPLPARRSRFGKINVVKLARKYKIRLTKDTKRGRVYKTNKQLIREIKKKRKLIN